MYIIFSDESGDTNNRYYLRSWVKFKTDKYEEFEKNFSEFKNKAKLKEVKYNDSLPNLITQYVLDFEKICETEFKIFITITDTQDLKSDFYSVYNKINKIPDAEFNTISSNFKSKILRDIKHQIFLNKFESEHLSRASQTLSNNDVNCKFIIDKPQANEKEYKDISSKVGISNINIEKKSNESPGIQLAGVIATCFKKILDDNNIEIPSKNNSPQEIFKKYFYLHMTDMNSKIKEKCNPNIIWFSRNTTLLPKLEKIKLFFLT